MASVRLYEYWRSSAAFRVRIALHLKGVDYTAIPVDLVANAQSSDEYLQQNPQGLVPALAAGQGPLLTQSIAILEWLEETRPEPPLLPRDPVERCRVRAMMQSIACDIHPLNNLRVQRYLVDELGVSEADKLGWYHHWIAQGFGALEQQVTGVQYCFGERLTLADVCLVPQMYNARRFQQDLAPYPKLVAIADYLEQLPAFAAAAPQGNADA
ncbi:MAG: maleylacetoacetate isomerase [Halieaceae bacterium]|jgi:maleylacetoacetate isomerase|uniref:maleylacetoacetate isomerase n=1 Tax=Haliea alexandrii TaxID=2448162 RepID=UPI000F0B2B13|nr:maleylacetoacetate isomerase [Haliea alexandrii]MCR9184673.1 maleylacetoacetate isomerase [Halieaceae bacterium]